MGAVSRDTWGAVGTVPNDPTDKDEIAVHHTVHANKLWTFAEACEAMRQIERDHIARGFATIGYSYVVFHLKNGVAQSFIGRGRQGLPAATDGQNTGTWAIALAGDYRTQAEHNRDRSGRKAKGPSVELRREVRRLIVLLRDQEGADHLGGHQEFPSQATACPGGLMLPYLRKWREDFGLSVPEPS